MTSDHRVREREKRGREREREIEGGGGERWKEIGRNADTQTGIETHFKNLLSFLKVVSRTISKGPFSVCLCVWRLATRSS